LGNATPSRSRVRKLIDPRNCPLLPGRGRIKINQLMTMALIASLSSLPFSLVL
jgi:hypothetical protein